MAAVPSDPFYYLANFRQVMDWVGRRYADLLDTREHTLLASFFALPQPAQALLVRMVMRKGELFRQSKLTYVEIDDTAAAAAALANAGLIDAAPLLALPELCGLLRKDEVLAVFADALGAVGKTARKEELLAQLQESFSEPRSLADWCADFGDTVYRLRDSDVYERLRLLFFGNLYQDWSEFVLADLGLLKYEAVEISAASRAFQTREDVEAYLHLYRCRERLEAREAARVVLAEVPGTAGIGAIVEAKRFAAEAAPTRSNESGSGRSGFSPTAGGGVGLKPDLQVPAARPTGTSCGRRSGFSREPLLSDDDNILSNPWLEERRGKLLFALGQQLEREKDLATALAVYKASSWPEARLRTIRVLEQSGRIEAAFALASELQQHSPREDEQQQIARILPRLRRKLGLEKLPPTPLLAPERLDFTLDRNDALSVEWQLREHLHADHTPVFYVENALVNSLFGLLCWPAIFAPVSGAFFHAFHYGPVDLHHPDFQKRREVEFAACFSLLDSGDHREAILATFRAKFATQSPFVFWEVLSEELLTLALDCIPPAHLRLLFTRLLADLKSNRSGFPDLIRFWPAEKRYLMLEVKGPGDRLQDNQIRWLDYCLRHEIPVAVGHVAWAAE